MPANNPQSRSFGTLAAAVFLLALVIVSAVVPWIRVVLVTVPRGTSGSAGVPIASLLNTCAYALVIGALATLCGLPAAWKLGRSSSVPRGTSRAGWLALVGGALLLPSYLPYAGWGLLRGPNTYLGDRLAVLSPEIVVWVGHAVAAAGMVMWCWPLAAVVLSGSVRGLNQATLEALRLESGGAVGRWWEVSKLLRGGLLSAAGCVALVVAGSAIPLHVSQVPTYAIELWKAMQLGHDARAVWVASAPLLGVAAVGAWVIARRVMRAGVGGAGVAEGGGSGAWAGVGTVLVWAVSVVVPLGLFAWSLGSWVSVSRFWRQSGAGVVASAEVGVVVGAAVAALMMGTWVCVSDGRAWARRAAGLALGAMLFCGLAPGVLVGAASAAAWGGVGWVRGNAAIVVFTHVARFGFVGVLAGWWLARQETREERWMREMDAGRAAGGWWATRVIPNWAVVVGVAVCAGALSFHEIESTVMVAPPGRQNLAQQMLDMLHYARDEQLSAAAVNLLGIGVLVGLAGAGLVGRGRGRGAGRMG